MLPVISVKEMLRERHGDHLQSLKKIHPHAVISTVFPSFSSSPGRVAGGKSTIALFISSRTFFLLYSHIDDRAGS